MSRPATARDTARRTARKNPPPVVARPGEVYARLARDRRAIEKTLAAAIGSNGTRVDEAARNGLLGGGKRVRPLLTCAVLRALNTSPMGFIGRVVAAQVREDALRSSERDDNDLIHEQALLAYLHPGRFCPVAESYSFPFPMDFSR